MRFGLYLATILSLSSGFVVAVPQEVDALGGRPGGGGGNTCRNPTVRKEWRSLTRQERAGWIAAVNCLAKRPHTDRLVPTVQLNDIPPVTTNSSLYDDLVYIHMDLNSKIHFTGLFLPWHRLYIHMHSLALKQLCGYDGPTPYWDWTKDVADFEHASFWDDNPNWGIGRWGDPAQDQRVTTGGFRAFSLAYPTRHYLRRQYTPQPYRQPWFIDQDRYANTTFTPQEIDYLVNNFAGDFKGFQTRFENLQGGAHGGPHLILGGDLAGLCPTVGGEGCIPGPTFSSNEPAFFLHHAMVDRVWWLWQNRRPQNQNAYEGGSIMNIFQLDLYPVGMPPALNFSSPIPTDGLFDGWTIGDVMNTRGGKLCYTYA